MDVERTGAFGFSTFGFFSARAMLLAPEVYSLGLAAAAPDFQASINDRMWYYVSFKPREEFKTNSMLADRLQGRLLFISGTEDVQGPLESTMSLIEALVRENKQCDLRIIPGASHAMFWPGQPYSEYFWDSVAGHFLDHLTRRIRTTNE